MKRPPPGIVLVSTALAAMATACQPPPAPKDIDSLSRWFWLNQKDGTNAQLLQGVQHLDAAAGALAKPLEETISSLQTGDAKAAGASYEGDLSQAQGLLLLDIIPCPLARVEALLVQADQKALHANYITFSRTFDGSDTDYLAGKTSTLDWSSSYQLSLVGWVFQAQLPGGSRFVTPATTGPTPRGPVLLAFAYFDEPAMSEGASSNYFKQSYQVQVFYERSPGQVVHLFATWVDLSVAGFLSNGDVVQTVMLNSLATSDQDYVTHCKD